MTLEGHLDTRHSRHLVIWVLEALGHSRHLGTWALRCARILDPQLLRHSFAWALEAIQALYLADSLKLIQKSLHTRENIQPTTKKVDPREKGFNPQTK